jgi:hypothetical protein
MPKGGEILIFSQSAAAPLHFKLESTISHLPFFTKNQERPQATLPNPETFHLE